ncbi:MAG: hypothetical protein J6S71_04200 [Clostridia bacterium]|nr:hypothetical protein [Clostridia bacterium]
MNKKTDKRLLSSLDYIDDKFTERAAKKIKTRQVGMTGGVSKKRMVKYVAMLAACMILLGAAIPIATSILNKLPDVIDPSASNAETTAPEVETPEIDKPEEYFSDAYFAGVDNVYKYEGQFIYWEEVNLGGDSYYRVVKYDPTTDKVSSVCLNSSCTHTYADCPVASPAGWNFVMDVFDDWLIYRTTNTLSHGNGPDGSKLCLYNLNTGETRTILERTQTGNIIKYAEGYLTFEGKVYVTVREIDISDPENKIEKQYITCYDPDTDENVYMLDEPENVGLIGISNKRFFYSEGVQQPFCWSSDYNGENLKKEENFTFLPLAVSGTYAYDYSIKDDDNNPATKNVYDLTTDSKFKIDFGGTLRILTILEDKLFYVIYKNADKTGGTELWTCDKRGENRQLILESEDVIFSPHNCIGNYIIGDTHINGIVEHYIFNTETGEIKAIPKLGTAN